MKVEAEIDINAISVKVGGVVLENNTPISVELNFEPDSNQERKEILISISTIFHWICCEIV